MSTAKAEPNGTKETKPKAQPPSSSGSFSLLQTLLLGVGLAGAAYLASSYLPDISSLLEGFSQTKKPTFTSGEDFFEIEDTTHCADLHHHVKSNTLFTACENSAETRFGWFPSLRKFSDPGAPVRSVGSFHVIDPSTMKSTRLEFENYEGLFVTQGIDVIDDPKQKGAVYLFAVNHLPNAQWAQWMQDPELKHDSERLHKSQRHIEIFHHVLGTTTVQLVRSVRSDYILMPTDIHAQAPDSFYVTNDPALLGSATRKVKDENVSVKSNVIHVQLSETWGAWNPESGINITIASTRMQNNNAIGHGKTHQEILVTSLISGTMLRGKQSSAESKRISYVDEFKVDPMLGSPSYFQDTYSKVKGDSSGYILPTQYRALERGLGQTKGVQDDTISVWQARRAVKGSNAKIWTREGSWEKRLLFEDDGGRIQSASSAVLLGIDPKTEDGMKKGWLFVTGLVAKNVIALKVDL